MRKTTVILILCMALLGTAKNLSANDFEAIQSLVFTWRDARQSKNIDQYISLYSPEFKSKELDYKVLKEKATQLFQIPGDISVKIRDLKISIKGKRATARFVQRFHGPTLSDIGEKTLILTKTDLSWKIISENWKPLSKPDRTTVNKTDPSRPVDMDNQVTTVYERSQEKNIFNPLEAETIVNSIQFKIEKDGTEKVLVALNRYSIPEIIALEGKNPRIAIDIKNVSIWDGSPKINVNGKFIKQIRTNLHADPKKLRIVLDLGPDLNYFINPTYFKSENTYCLEVGEDTLRAQPKPDIVEIPPI